MPRFALCLAFDGTDFHGWIAAPGQRSVSAEIIAACHRLGEPSAAVVGASRLDAGVHAARLIAHLDLHRAREAAALAGALNQHLPSDVRVRAAAAVADDWDAINAAVAKTYRYRLDVGAVACADVRRLMAWRPAQAQRISVALAQQCAERLRGEHAWTAFRRRGEQRSQVLTRIHACRWRGHGRWLDMRICGTAFSYHLVRSLVGGMVAVASAQATFDEWNASLAGDVTRASMQQAPAQGLTLIATRLSPVPGWSSF